MTLTGDLVQNLRINKMSQKKSATLITLNK